MVSGAARFIIAASLAAMHLAGCGGPAPHADTRVLSDGEFWLVVFGVLIYNDNGNILGRVENFVGNTP